MVLSDEEEIDGNGEVDLPGFRGMRSEFVSDSQSADCEHPCPKELVETELVR